MKAVILARISSKEQKEGHSLDAQIRNLRLYAERKNLEIVREYTLVESSTKGHRPEFGQMIHFIKSQKQKMALVVDTVDRLQRSFRETPVLNELMEQDVLELHFVKEGNVLSKGANSSQKLMWNMGVVMAQSYTDQLSDNVKRSIYFKVRNGEWCGPAPLGYLNAVDGNTGKATVIPNPANAELIKRLFQEYSTGTYSLAELARKSREWGLRSNKGNKLGTQQLHGMIQNPFYYGMMKVKDELYPHKYEPLISKGIFEVCQYVRTGRGRKDAVKETKFPFLFRGLIKCTVSGRTVSCDLKKGKYVSYLP
jgi:DNA invertase Pin-like site-specific DNA recombinase